MTRMMRRHSTLRVAMFCAGIAMLAPLPVRAQSVVQGVPNAMQGFSTNRDQPIKIESETLEMRDKKKEATFTGHVKVVQGDTTLLSDSLLVYYDGSEANGAAKGAPKAPAAKNQMPGASNSSIRRLEAKGNVIVTQRDQVVTGETAIYDTKTNLVTMLGNVVLTQGPNVLRGDRLLTDMTTGISRVESDSGRVQGLFQSSGQQGGGNPLKPADGAKPPAKKDAPLAR